MARLDEPITIGSVRLRNRLVLAPLSSNFGSADGEVTDGSLGFYRQRARHVGMVVVEATTVRADGRITPYSLGLWDDAQIPGMRALARTIKGEGAVAAIQISHAGARSAPVEGGIRCASPSGFPFRTDVEPTILDEDRIEEIGHDFANAAARAAEAGFDAIEVHAAHFYLLSEFLSPLTNKREDRFGGDAAGRSTLPVAVVRAVRERVGPRYPVLVRINAFEAVEGGQTVEDAIVAAKQFEAAGVAAIDVTTILKTSWREVDGRLYLQAPSPLPKEAPRGANAPYVARIKRAVGVPAIAVGKLGDPEAAAALLADGTADLVAVGRQMIADPEAAGKMLAGRGEAIVRCKECLSCLNSLYRGGGGIVCATNRNLSGTPEYAPAQ